MDSEGINKDCLDKGLKRNAECNTPENGGKYQVMNLRDYLAHQEKLNPTSRFTKSTSGEKQYVHFFRSCEHLDTSIIDDRGTYDEEWNKLKVGTRRSTFPFMDQLNNISTDRMGLEPGIGINVGLTKSVPENYFSGRVTSDGINKLHRTNPVKYPSAYVKDYGSDYAKLHDAMIAGKAYIYELMVEISEEIMVCAIVHDCTWNQITCDKKTSDNFDLIGHVEQHLEMNILAKCPYIVYKRTLCNLDPSTGEIQVVTPEEILNVPKGASNYRKKYLKYKNKYLELKKLIK